MSTKAYLIAHIFEIQDHASYSKYQEAVASILPHYQGQYLVRSEKVNSLSDWKVKRTIVIAFPDREMLDTCFSSPEYLKIKRLREGAVTSKAIIVEG